MRASFPTILILPGLNNSGVSHWQSVWESTMPNAMRVIQKSWDAPDCADWVAMLDIAVNAAVGPVVFVAHSLGCALVTAWVAEHGHNTPGNKVQGALLVAPPDVERADFPSEVTGFAPMRCVRLPFKSIVVASSNDAWCDLDRAERWAEQWGAAFHQIGAKGHINAASGLMDWPEGKQLLTDLSIP